MEDNINNAPDNKRWYDKDPILKEALELLRLSSPDEQEHAKDFILQLQEQVAGEVIERIYEIITQYEGKGNRWYDNDPVMIKAIEILRHADPKTQRHAALKLLLALEEKASMNDVQNQTDKRNIDIQKVGVKDVEIPLVIQRKLKNGAVDTQRVYAKAKMSVSLNRQFKGTHMSRFIEILNDYRKKNRVGVDIK